MKLEKLNELIALDSASLAENRDDIAKLVEAYPYCGPFRILLAKASKEAGHLDQRKDLLAAASHCTSRKALFDIMFSENIVEHARIIHKEITQLDEVSEEDLVGLIWHTEEKEGSELIDHFDSKREEVVAAISSILDENSSKIIEDRIKVEQQPEFSPKEQQIREGGRANSLFGKWLEERAKATEFGGSARIEDLEERGAAVIIDAFLAKDNPQIGKIRDIDSPVEKWASKGLEEDLSLVTETLAKLYAKQGQISRARKAFKLLADKFPDKSVYFAAQLKKLINK
ncbi:MAG: hypothetical protein CL850_02115 [Crocinitomicaceae bacterium]|nr:hypothetical protein [Crocinitomicaceae bacterium]|tara:strand:+ start:268 stop:1122 length:855 start_codon:yes stop_codon:yes gene_type:complete